MDAPSDAASGCAATDAPSDATSASTTVVVWLNDVRHECAAPANDGPLLDVLTAHGVPYRLRTRAWRDSARAGEALLDRAGPLEGPLEIVHNGALATVGVTHLRVRPGDEVVIGQPSYLRQRFAFFR